MPCIYPCGPHRFATGLLKTKDGIKNSLLLTWGEVEGNIIDYNPATNDSTNKIVYKKKTYKVSDLCSFTIRVQAGEIATLEGETYDGTMFSTPITGKFEINLAHSDWAKQVEEGKDGIELIDLDKKEETKEKPS